MRACGEETRGMINLRTSRRALVAAICLLLVGASLVPVSQADVPIGPVNITTVPRPTSTPIKGIQKHGEG